eukprot:TRINITY_DN77825_c0_g1_i1.p1 TRINITY_DN77825_c0_g1~~TRINITY_DN77825_c0_g1_i1.p1  ORF type:complete len:521 (+),score=86.28 TRINITY_DN77825_c0_g1_i1:61-1563(+)
MTLGPDLPAGAAFVTKAMLQDELKRFAEEELQRELSKLRSSILDELAGAKSLMLEVSAREREMEALPASSRDEILVPLKDWETDREDAMTELAISTLEVRMKSRLSFGGGIPKHTVYGIALVIPQIARSAGWTRLLRGLAMRAYILLGLNYAIMFMLLYMIQKEENVMDRFAGQMNLCDFGAFLSQCPEDASNCMGPSGTVITPSRLYTWNTWSTRMFMRDSLAALFPKLEDEIAKKIDPGEYGVEDYRCRVLCCFVYVVSVISEGFSIFCVARLLYEVPSRDDCWISYSKAAASQQDEGEDEGDTGPHLDDVELEVSGMPLHWKVVNVLVLVMPRLGLWTLTLQAGVTFLMESASIEDTIVNAVALTFILGVAATLEDAFSARATKELMDKLKDFEMVAEQKHTAASIKQSSKEYQEHGSWSSGVRLLPWRLGLALVLTAVTILRYYVRYCVRDKNGHWVSSDMFFPRSVHYDFANLMFPSFFPVEHEDAPFWEQPKGA